MDSSATPKIQHVDTTPSGGIGAIDKGNKGEKKDAKTTEAKVAEIDKGKSIADQPIVTPPVTGTLPQIPINLDGYVDLGKMSHTENLMLVATMKAQAS